MISIPAALLTRFEECLFAHNIADTYHIHYKKWLRFYLDFCEKYLVEQGSEVGWGEARTPTLCRKTGGMQCDTGARGLMAAPFFHRESCGTTPVPVGGIH